MVFPERERVVPENDPPEYDPVVENEDAEIEPVLKERLPEVILAPLVMVRLSKLFTLWDTEAIWMPALAVCWALANWDLKLFMDISN